MDRQTRRRRGKTPRGAQVLSGSRCSGHPSALNARAVPLLFCVAVLSACAGPEKTFRDAHDVVTEVIDLTANAGDSSETENLYALEERVEAACRPIFKSAHRQWVFGDIPLYTQLATLVSTHRCRRTVDEARRLLDDYHLQQRTPPGLIPPEGGVIYSN